MDVQGNLKLKHYGSEIDFNILKETFSNIQVSSNFAMDIGGSLIKIVYQTKRKLKRKVPVSQEISYDYIDSDSEQSCLCFTRFETRHLTECLNFVLENIVSLTEASNENCEHQHIKVTGGGAVKFKELISQKLNIIVDKVDEMESLIKGCVFLLKNIPDEVFYFEDVSEMSVPHFSSCLMNLFPFLLVNIGSGVSILRVDDEHTFTRVGGTSIGGGTFWGIGSLLSGGKTFDDLLLMASMGNYKNVDMLVRDIYGGSYDVLNLPEDLIASSFGHASRKEMGFSKEDVINSLLFSICNNIAQLACLHADLCGMNRIIFGGFFTRGHILTMKLISSSVDFWSKDTTTKALFLRHEGYLGAIGAFLESGEVIVGGASGTEQQYRPIEMHNLLNSSWLENYAGSASYSLYTSPETTDLRCSRDSEKSKFKYNASISKSLQNLSISAKALVGFETRELECIADKLEIFRLLDSPQSYLPDSWDLTSDDEAKKYWLQCFKDNVPRETAYESQKDHSETAETRSMLYKKNYLSYLTSLEENPSMHGVLTVRCLLDAHQNFLRKYGFTDPFWMQKKNELLKRAMQKENELALKMFEGRMKQLEELEFDARQYELIVGFLAGNVFDWGSKEVVALMESSSTGTLDFSDAVNKLQKRPWLNDGYDKWLEKLKSRPPNEPVYQSVLIFCDNSGFDFIIGIVPFVVEMLTRGSTVVLSANSEPAINDVTHSEIVIIIKTLAQQCAVLEKALRTKKLLLVPNGQMSPCLDLRFVTRALNCVVELSKVDLVVIEGMARAVHTNLHVQLSCDSLKIAVIKNAWLAKRLGGDLFSVIFKYEQFSLRDKLLNH